MSSRKTSKQMTTKASGCVRQKGELVRPKQAREETGLKRAEQAVYKADHGRIEVVKIPWIRGEILTQKDDQDYVRRIRNHDGRSPPMSRIEAWPQIDSS